MHHSGYKIYIIKMLKWLFSLPFGPNFQTIYDAILCILKDNISMTIESLIADFIS